MRQMAYPSFSTPPPYPVAFILSCKEGYAILSCRLQLICIEWRLDMALRLLRRHRFKRFYALGADDSTADDTPQVFVAFGAPHGRALLRVAQKTRHHRQST